jgi:hypothetical protein
MAFDQKPSRWNCHPSQPRNRIRYFVAPNVDKRAGGFCPLYRVNNERMAYSPKRTRAVRGHAFCTGYDKATAIRMAKAAAYDEAERHYGGSDCTTVVYSARGERGLGGARKRRRR